MIVNLTPDQRKVAKKWHELREKYPGKTREEILAREPKKHKAEIFTIEEKAFGVEGRDGGIGGATASALRLQTERDKRKHL